MPMEMWEAYQERLGVTGEERDMRLNYTQKSIAHRICNSLSYHQVMINGTEQAVSILNRQDLSEKIICALPGERLIHGGIVDFAQNKWLITELDANNKVYERGIMLRCNHVLRWIGKDGTLKEKWCVIEDGTKYLIGEKSEDIMSIGDARIALTIGKDEDTIELHRGMRFLIDDGDSQDVLAYQITKPNKLFNIYNNVGVFKFILNEVNITKNDNIELRIADYNIWHPDVPLDGDHRDSELSINGVVDNARQEAAILPDDNKGVWL